MQEHFTMQAKGGWKEEQDMSELIDLQCEYVPAHCLYFVIPIVNWKQQFFILTIFLSEVKNQHYSAICALFFLSLSLRREYCVFNLQNSAKEIISNLKGNISMLQMQVRFRDYYAWTFYTEKPRKVLVNVIFFIIIFKSYKLVTYLKHSCNVQFWNQVTKILEWDANIL